METVSCASAGSCAAGGFYRDRHRHRQAFVVAERNGRWRRVIEVPGLGTLYVKKGTAGVSSVSCTSADSCTAVGNYTDKARNQQGFVVAEKNGGWGKAVALPGLAALGGGEVSQVSFRVALSGRLHDRRVLLEQSSGGQGWVADEKNGIWGKAIAVPGLEALNKGGGVDVYSLSCGAAGSCVIVGDYANKFSNDEGWVAVEKNGVWGKAFEPPGLAALNGSSGGGNAGITSSGIVRVGGQLHGRRSLRRSVQ